MGKVGRQAGREIGRYVDRWIDGRTVDGRADIQIRG